MAFFRFSSNNTTHDRLIFRFEMNQYDKVGRFFAMVISSDFRVGQHRDDDHEEDALYFTELGVRKSWYLKKTNLFDDSENHFVYCDCARVTFHLMRL